MKICIPTKDNRGLESRAHGHFGSAPFFAMVDADSDRLEVVRNTDLHHGPHSCHHVDGLKAHDVDAVVCSGVGRRAFAALQEAGIDVLAPEHATVADIVSAMRAGEVRRLSTDEVCGGGRHEHRHGAGVGYGQGNCHAHGPGHRGAASHPLRRRGM